MSHVVAAHAGDYDVRLLDAADQFADIEDAWKKLEGASDQPCLFQSYAWSGHVAEVMSRAYPAQYVPLVAVAARNGETVAIWPLSRQKRAGIWLLRSLDDPFGQFSGLLATDASAAEALVAKTLALVRTKRLADILRLNRVLAGGPLEVALLTNGAIMRGEVGAPVLDLRQWPDMASLKSSRNKKTMKNLRNATNRLTKAGEHHHRVASGGADVSAIVESTLLRRAAWLKEKGLTAPSFRLSAHVEILTGGQAWGLDQSRTAFELRHGGDAIAQQWGFVHQRRYYAYMSATDPAAIHLSPGRLHLSFVLEDVMNAGVEAIEMLTPASDYKMVWTDTVRPLRDYAMPLSMTGRIQDAVWERLLRPALKALFYALPVAMRRRATPHDVKAESDAEYRT